MIRVLATLAAFLLALPSHAQCTGQNILELLPASEREAVQSAADAQPYAKGNFWRATKGDQTLYLMGTFHLDDPRHDALMAKASPFLAQAKSLLAEAGPAEEEALRAKMAGDPGTMMEPGGSGLEASLPPEDWAKLTEALLQRGIPSSVSEKLRPWFISMMLGLPPCALQVAAAGKGLDKRIMAAGQTLGLPVTALEPFDTALRLFDGLGQEEQITMIRNALQLEDRSADYLATTAEAFFAEESRLIWELNRLVAKALPDADPTATDAEFAQMEQALMGDRNAKWLPVLTAAPSPAFAAFGALHLSGKTGVLALLATDGWSLERIAD